MKFKNLIDARTGKALEIVGKFPIAKAKEIKKAAQDSAKRFISAVKL